MRIHKTLRNLLAVAVLALGAVMGCTSIDCPLDNAVSMTCNIYSLETEGVLKLTDTLTVRAKGSDSILLNRGIGIDNFELPLRYREGTDTLLFRFSNDLGQWAVDTLFVTHTAQAHFESEDCPIAFFHKIGDVNWTIHPLADMPLTIGNVIIKRERVDYENQENLRIFLRTTTVE